MSRLKSAVVTGLACGILWTLAAGSAAAIEMRPYLSLEAANKMAEACIAKARQEGWPMHIAIIDPGGNLKLYARLDDTSLASQQIAMMKAHTAATFQRATKRLGEAAFRDGQPGPLAFVPGLQFFEGGLPIKAADGTHLGGIGVSGSSGQNDAICAQAGLDAAAELL